MDIYDAAVLRVAVLGQLEVQVEGRLIDAGSAKQRQLVALLALAGGAVIPGDELVERLWSGRPPASAAHAVQVYVSAVRRQLRDAGAPPSLATADGGYQLVDVDLDARQFADLIATDRPSEALALWRGEPYPELPDDERARAEAARLGQLRVAALEVDLTRQLALGEEGRALARLEVACAEFPFHERFWELAMLALYRAGRQADALRRYQVLRTRLAEELGIEPGAAIRDLEHMILGQAAELERLQSAPQAAAPQVRTHPAAGSTRTVPDEQRTVTALFSDLVGSTPLGETLDPDEFKLVVDGAIARVTAAVDRYGGTVIGIAGDGVCALFGAPVAHEDDTERAVRAGLDVIASVGAYGEQVGRDWGVKPLAVRVGVHVGPVAIGLIGGSAEADLTALGDTMNLASRIEANAPANTVLVSRAAKDLCEAGFDWADPAFITVKGKSAPVEVAAAVGMRPGSVRRRGLDGIRAPLTARSREFEEGRRALGNVLDGRGGVLAVSGLAGHGKSRLLSELRAEFEGHRHGVWLEGTCASYDENEPHQSLRQALGGWAGVVGLPGLRAQVVARRRFAEVLGTAMHSATTGHEAGWLALLNLGGERRPAPEDVPLACEALLQALAANQPVVLALDDLQWADSSTLEIVRRLLPLTDRAALLIVLVARPERTQPSWEVREFARRELGHRYTEIELAPLSDADTASLLDALTGAATLPTQVRAELLAMASGVPFYLEELVRALMASGALVREDTGFRYDETRPTDLPPSVEQVVVSRLSRLPPLTREVAAAAALLGHQFGPDLLAAAVSDAGPAELEEALQLLQRADLLVEARRWPSPQLRFVHALGQGAIAATLTSERRRTIHLRVVSHLEALDDPVEAAAELARHCEGAQQWTKAFNHRRLAAAAAEAVSGTAEAAAHYSAALGLADDGRAQAPSDAVADVLLALGRCMLWLDRQADCETALLRVVELAATAKDPVREQAALEQLGLSDMYRDLALAEARFTRLATLARLRGDVGGEVTALSRTSIVIANRAELDRAAALATRALALADSTGDRALRMVALDAHKLHLAYVGDFTRQTAVLDELEAYQREHGDYFHLPYTMQERWFAHAASGRFSAALAVLEEAIEVASARGTPIAAGPARAWRCEVLTVAGRLGEALGAADLLAQLDRTVDSAWFGGWYAFEIGVVSHTVGRLDTAVEHLGKAYENAAAIGFNSYALLGAGRLALLTLQDEWLDRALALLSNVTAPPGRVYLVAWDAYVSIGEALLRRGDRDRAISVVGPMVTAATEVGWHGAVAAASLVLAGALPRPRRGPLVDLAVAAAARSTAPVQLWQATAAAAGLAETVADKARLLVDAQRSIDRLAATLTGTEDRAVFERFAQAELELLVTRFETG